MSSRCPQRLPFSKLSSSFVGGVSLLAVWRVPVLLPLPLAGALAFDPMHFSRHGQRCVAEGVSCARVGSVDAWREMAGGLVREGAGRGSESDGVDLV